MHQTLIVARMRPGRAEQVADVFARSDATDLPGMLGVSRRSLFRFHDLYFHLVESTADLRPDLAEVRRHPLFQQINTELEEHIEAYDPETWRTPNDAMAERFYLWTRD